MEYMLTMDVMTRYTW